MPELTDREILFDLIRTVAGEDALDRMLGTFGGARRRLPARAVTGGWFADFFGLEDAQRIIDQFTVRDADGLSVEFEFYVPLGNHSVRMKLREEARRLYNEGMKTREIARRLKVCERTVHRMTAYALKKPPKTASGETSEVKRKRRGKPRIGLLETLIIAGTADSGISHRTGLSRNRIATRRQTLRRAGLLPSPDHPADPGGMIPPADGAPS